MGPFVAQAVVALIQSLIQSIEAKLSHEERIVIVVDPIDFKDDAEKSALDLVCGKAKLTHRVGEEPKAST